jgi:hypothetical protein
VTGRGPQAPPPRGPTYAAAATLAREQLAALDARAQARRVGCEVVEGPPPRAVIRLVDWALEVRFDTGAVADARTGATAGEVETVLALHLLVHGEGPLPPPGELVGFRQMPSGAFYEPAFHRRAEAPLERAFGARPAALVAAARALGGEPREDLGDAAATITAFPLLPITLVLWACDEEFPASAKVLLRENASALLPTEDLAALCGLVAYRVIARDRE